MDKEEKQHEKGGFAYGENFHLTVKLPGTDLFY